MSSFLAEDKDSIRALNWLSMLSNWPSIFDRKSCVMMSVQVWDFARMSSLVLHVHCKFTFESLITFSHGVFEQGIDFFIGHSFAFGGGSGVLQRLHNTCKCCVNIAKSHFL